MKFSHSIQLNSKVEWQDCEYAYSNLKKWIYLIEKAKLGLVTLPRSYREADPSIFLSALTQQQQQQHQTPRMSTDDEEAPLLSANPDHIAPPAEAIESFFREALDDQLDKIVQFYANASREIFAEIEAFAADVTEFETPHDSQMLVAQQTRLTPVPELDVPPMTSLPEALATPSAPSVAITPRSRPSLSRLRRFSTSSSPSLASAEPGTPVSTAWSIFYGHDENKALQSKFRKQGVACYVSLNELDDYRELNHTGFAKILKKYEKVTGQRLKQVYMAKVNAALPFCTSAVAKLRDEIDAVVRLYARVAAEGSTTQASKELRATLRDHIVWERNTVWRDMVEQERRTASLNVRRKSVSRESDTAVRCCGCTLSVPRLFTYRTLTFTLFVGIFACLVSFEFFDTVEQQNCLAILFLASSLWAFEVLPLFATALLIPLLVVTLRVMREIVKLPDGTAEYHRMDAKAAAKRVFSEMFSGVIILLLGGFSLAAALSKHHIAKGVASVVLGLAGSQPKFVLLANIFLSTFLSMWISNVAAPAVCFSLIAPILRNLPSRSPYAKSLILGIALAANVGGMASPISSPQNIVAIGTLSDMHLSVSWPEWFAIALPVCFVIDLGIWLILLLVYRPETAFYVQKSTVPASSSATLPSTGLGISTDQVAVVESVPPQQSASGKFFVKNPITLTQVFVLFITIVTIGLWCVESSIEAYVGDMGIIALVPIVAFYGTGILSKDDWNSQLWNVVALAMGGICLGKAVDSSGLLANITSKMTPYLSTLSPYMSLVLMSMVVLVVTSFISHTVGALIILPVVAQIGANMPDPQPRLLVMSIALICSGAMGLPVSSFPNMNAISQEDSTGEPWLSVLDFIKVGLVASVVACGAIVGVGYQVMIFMGFK
ncbi:SPX domain-containing protein [Zopfochytrium polystomum]|nr:SPX domain-containing protein [Zopfochytrium polystomum]